MRLPLLMLSVMLSVVSWASADGPGDNLAENVRRIPAEGVALPPEVLESLQGGLANLGDAIKQLEKKNDPKTRALLPDVRIFHKAVADAIKYHEFLKADEGAKAKVLLQEGQERAAQLLQGQAPWTVAAGLVVRGYVSRIDGSVQPYGLVIPDSYSRQGSKVRLDVWLHGRSETLTEINFLDERRKSRGQFTPADTIVLHPYGRYCNAFKFAGEIDVLEALEDVKKNYHIDEDLVAIRGFSMGGAGCWHLAVHYPGLWFAANPGAGFSGTPQFLKVFQQEDLKPSEFEKTLWRWYDCPYYAGNVRHVPTVAYSGADDKQKQAADIMEKALNLEGLDLLHVIGPGTKHAYHPQSKEIVEQKMNALASVGRERFPQHVRFTTQMLRYHECAWVSIEGLNQHWKNATVDAKYQGDEVIAQTDNVTDLRLAFPAGRSPFEITAPVVITIDGQRLRGPRAKSDRSWECDLYRDGRTWKVGTRPDAGLRKRPGLQGPIDDAFMDTFVMVRPTGKFQNAATEKWVKAEMEHALTHWRRHFRGEARVIDDTQVDEATLQRANLVLWGDPTSNTVLAKIGPRLPIRWDAQEIAIGKYKYPIEKHALTLIYPNPLNPNRYVVLNSGFTFREYDYLNNARQVPKLPDWAVIDFTTPPNPRFPGKIADQGFFTERWETGY